jgi:hypothetical protein
MICGALSATFLMAFIDTFYLMGITPFSFELYLGGLIRQTPYGQHNWTLGFLASLGMGALFGIFYGYCFEYVFFQAKSRIGMWVGVWHIIAAGVGFFPFFGVMHEYLNTGLYPEFGFLGSSLGAVTPILLMLVHLFFGASMGLFYGGVRAERVRDRYFEPGESGQPGDPDVITETEEINVA